MSPLRSMEFRHRFDQASSTTRWFVGRWLQDWQQQGEVWIAVTKPLRRPLLTRLRHRFLFQQTTRQGALVRHQLLEALGLSSEHSSQEFASFRAQTYLDPARLTRLSNLQGEDVQK